ncbi:MAG: alpha/beta fold hydrolase [Beijerinckiaceae bacterium]
MLPRSEYFHARDGIALHYLEWAGRSDTILFLHGGALTAHTWDLVALALSDAFRCIALDLRGHGLSGWSADYSIDAGVRDVEALVEHLGVESLHIVGMSLGGNVAAHYAALPASRAKTLTMVDVGPWIDFDSTLSMRDFMSQPIGHLSLQQLVDGALKASASGGRDKILYRYMHMTHTLADGSLAWCRDDRTPLDFPHILAKLDELATLAPAMRCRALIVRGGRSRVLTDDKAARFAALFQQGQWAVVAEAGHNIQEDKPKELAALIRAFLQRQR